MTTPPDTQTDTPAAPVERTLEADEVRLHDGRLVRVRKTTAAHDTRADLLAAKAGLFKSGLNWPIIARLRTLLAIEIDGTPIMWPRGRREEVMQFLEQFSSGDVESLAAVYDDLNGIRPVTLKGL